MKIEDKKIFNVEIETQNHQTLLKIEATGRLFGRWDDWLADGEEVWNSGTMRLKFEIQTQILTIVR